MFIDRHVDPGARRGGLRQPARAGEAVRHLLRLGHTRIALLDTTLEVSSHRERAEGYHQVMKEARLGPDPATWPGQRQRSPTASPPPCGCWSSPPPHRHVRPQQPLTIGALQAISARGLRCPEDISLVSYDDYEWQEAFRPRLTTIAQPGFLLGQRGAEVLIARITGDADAPPNKWC